MVRSPIPRGAAQYINVIRYDLLYGSLTTDERKEVEEAFRIYIDNQIFKRAILDTKIFNDSKNFSRYDARKYTRTNWLPNIIWPWKVSANLMAAAFGDEKLIRKVWGAYGSWKWYFDEYLCNIGFYSEEFGKMGSTPGAMLLYCRALERLGLNELGYGYKGKGGATMRGHIESLIHLGYPLVDVSSERPQYPMLTIGDLRQSGSSQSWNLPSPAFQYSIVMGYTPDGKGGNERWKAHGAWGGVIRGKHALRRRCKFHSGLRLVILFGPKLVSIIFWRRCAGLTRTNIIHLCSLGLTPLSRTRSRPPLPGQRYGRSEGLLCCEQMRALLIGNHRRRQSR
jgi:hypothetical protein